ncbi:hypothetical protein KP004_05670 [Geomonas oryzisoli]|uniref:PD-(D/E)XK nuclease-like domain-containing protein n=1 Tax=Geomonas oryzisoli TaxID=2847992 RepID=A0ABX8JBA1_9BACT|nr:hypothetical protein [Geomonas oryzisoli]QWV94667.1 hypothetical protein KP004_05670 [Geomonas oryzisoli]
MKLGNQYHLDDPFKAAARLHQSRYRAEVLKVADDEYGNRLNEHDARELLNYYAHLNSREVLRRKYPGYSKKRDADMLRSEHIPFNMLAPLDCDRLAAAGIIFDAFGIACDTVSNIHIEFAPDKSVRPYLGDGTAFDAYLEVMKPGGAKCGIGIEVKYTEQSYRIGITEKVNVENKDSLYWETARWSGEFIDPDDDIFGTDELRQIWRTHLLGLSMVKHGDLDEFYSITLFPDGNEHFHNALGKYRSLLSTNGREHVFGCTFEKFISSIHGNAEFDAWKLWLERRYLVK